MSALDALWHVLNALAAPLGVAVISTLAARWLWPRVAAATSGIRLLAWAYLPAVCAHLGTWAAIGVEGSMLGYALVVAACATGLWLGLFLRASPVRRT